QARRHLTPGPRVARLRRQPRCAHAIRYQIHSLRGRTMGTSIDWEGNIGSAPEFKEFANGNKDPRRLLRLNVYFDNSIPKSDGTGFEDRGGFWANVEFWHK
ncbi:Single-stranded DNA-binding protein, partial [Pseudomonas amygdali pv. sesami]